MADGMRAYEAVLFDVFGTLVEYQPDRVRLSYPRTHGLLATWGHQVEHDDFLAAWDAASAALEAAAEQSSQEFSMFDAAVAYCERTGLDLSTRRCQELGDTFVAEWQQHVQPVAGVTEMIQRMAGSLRLGVVSNTHDPAMVPSILGAMGVAEHMELVVLSVDHGFRKPHPSIYEAAIDTLGCQPRAVAFVGDSHAADYVGPVALGMDGYLIDPDRHHDVPARARLSSVLDIEALTCGPSDPT